MANRTFVVGVGMTPFEKPGAMDWDYPDMGKIAASRALDDAGISYDLVEQAFLGYCYGDSTSGQRALYEIGLTGIPAVNVNNNCSTGSSALYLARNAVRGGLADCVLALGFEKMEPGSLGLKYTDRTPPMEWHFAEMKKSRGMAKAPPAAQLFGNAGLEHMERYGTSPEIFAKIAEKNHRHSVNNPYAQFQTAFTVDEILASPSVYGPLTKLQCCPTSDGGAAAVVVSERFVRQHGLEELGVEILAQSMATDSSATFSGSDIELVGVQMTTQAARAVYAESGLGPENVDVIELHDCFSTNELVTYEALDLCEEGQAPELVESGATTYGGEWVINPSGGLISKGHPLGATGLAQCAELTWQLRGQAERRQVPGAQVALQHNLGLGGAVVVTLYRTASL